MDPNYSQIFNSRVLEQIDSYCSLNNIEDVDKFISDCFRQGFNIEKYGLLGKTLNDGEKHLKIDGEQEKQVEIEVIVEKRVEVPIEKVITKIEYITDKNTEDELGGIIAKLEENIFQLNKDMDNERQNFSIKTTEMENNFQNEMSKKDKELDELRRNLDEILDKPRIEKPNDKVNLLQQTVQNLTLEVRELKKKNEELQNKLINQETQVGDTPAKFFGGSNIKL